MTAPGLQGSQRPQLPAVDGGKEPRVLNGYIYVVCCFASLMENLDLHYSFYNQSLLSRTTFSILNFPLLEYLFTPRIGIYLQVLGNASPIWASFMTCQRIVEYAIKRHSPVV